MNNTNKQFSDRNKAVRQAYYAILKLAKRMLSTIERLELRYTLVRKERPLNGLGLIDEFCSPLLYLRLEVDKDGIMAIRYGFEPGKEYEHIIVPFVRSVYRLTEEVAQTNGFVDPIRLDWYIHNSDDMYAYLEEQNKYHTFELIEYKVTGRQRKQILRVA